MVGTGLIGSRWAACFLAHGLDVVATDPAPGAEAALHGVVARCWPALERLGLAPQASPDRLGFAATLDEAVRGADWVQENVPDEEELKVTVIAAIDAACPPGAIIASSTSGIPPTLLQSRCRHPERVLAGHPSNPAHILPLVEVVAGERTAPEAAARAMSSTPASASARCACVAKPARIPDWSHNVCPEITPGLKRTLDEQTREEAAGRTLEEWEALRHEFLVRLVELKRELVGEY